METLNKEQIGTSTDVHYSEVVLYWRGFAKNNLFYFLSAAYVLFSNIYTRQNTVLIHCLKKSVLGLERY